MSELHGDDLEAARAAKKALLEQEAGSAGKLSRFTLFAASLFGGAAALASRPETASATYNVACCTLAKPNGSCPGGSGLGGFSCPSGYTKRYWYCCYGGRLWGCGECTKASTCWAGPFACSKAWSSQNAC